jgi:hypothetical protein
LSPAVVAFLLNRSLRYTLEAPRVVLDCFRFGILLDVRTPQATFQHLNQWNVLLDT